MKFEVTILGCGSALPTPSRHPSAQLINIMENYFLVDCGEGTQLQLRRTHAKFQRIKNIFISHLHGDHYLGLMGLISTFHLLGRQHALNIHGPPELQAVLEHQLEATDTRLRFPLHFHTISHSGLETIWENDQLKVEAFPLDHRVPCYGFLFSEKPKPRNIRKEKLKEYDVSIKAIQELKNGKDVKDRNGKDVSVDELTYPPPPHHSYAYCSDTRFLPGLEEYVKNVDVLYHEATFLSGHSDRAQETYHSTAVDAAKAAEKVGAQRLVLGHYSARYKDLTPFLEESRAVFSRTYLGWDLLSFRVDEDEPIQQPP